ncbi:MAG: transketolase [Deltaproteobacteria bacterium]|nr:transketolase [Deltaproteobacteria bacterium]
MSDENKVEYLKQIAKLIRYYTLIATTNAGSGHPTSAMSATELMVGLVFGGTFRYDPDHPGHPNNDRLIFSKGHASPLFYSLWAAAGKLTEADMLTYRQFGSNLEGHPTVTFPYNEAATGSLGQGLSIGVGMALNARFIDKLPYRTYVLLGDSEMAEGSQWEAMQIASHYKLDNLVGVIDVNRLGQRGETLYGHDLNAYEKRISAFGWETFLINGHSIKEILSAYEKAFEVSGKPVMIIARTIKGKGVSFLEDRNGWHGKIIDKDRLEQALKELGPVDKSVRGHIPRPEDLKPREQTPEEAGKLDYPPDKEVATRTAYGNALKRIYPKYPRIVSLDGEVSNSTMSVTFKDAYPDRFFEMYIAEQNMAGVALGFARRGKIPFVSTFSAFLSRAFDQIRMSQYSDANIKFVGSHAGVSIGQDGPSQMGLEDIAAFRTILNSVVLYPSDAVSTERLVEAAAEHEGIVYIRTTRMDTPILYTSQEKFPIGGCKILKRSDSDRVTVIGAGVTLFETLGAYEALKKEGVLIRVIDLYSIKPIDAQTLREAARETKAILTVEDHYEAGGLGEAVMSALAAESVPVYSLAVTKKPRSGKPAELLDFEGISQKAIAARVRALIGRG